MVLVGTRLGPYEILSLLGAGGMGEVYRAHDTALGRDVAIKILPDAFARDPERISRFEREAKTLAALNHANIAHIYGFEKSTGVHALVMELVEGDTLADRIARGAIPLDETLHMARQIAEALEAAHDSGIMHRDLKPANIKIRPDGTVKVLDFGLAKALEPASAASSTVSMSPTVTSPVALTQGGLLLGTAPYMSPEQARGRTLDKRTDIWAFGCVLFEMLTTRRAFEGEDVAETIGAIIHKEPAWHLLPASTPPPLVRLLRRCLERDPRQRLRDAGDARLEIDGVIRAPEVIEPMAGHSAAASRSRLAVAGWLVATALGLLALGIAVVHFTERPADVAPAARFEVGPTEEATLVTGPSVSPDGRLIAFGARDDRGLIRIWLRSLDSPQARPLSGTEGNIGLTFFWSSDSRFIAFAARDRTLKKVDVSGGLPQKITDLNGSFGGGDWNRDGVIIFAVQGQGLQRVSADGGAASTVTTIDRTRDRNHVEPVFLPDGRRFLYTSLANERDQSAVSVGSLDGKPESTDSRLLVGAGVRAVYAPSSDPQVGHLLFVRDGTLMSQPFDAGRLQLGGQAVALAEGISESAGRNFSVSKTGVLAFRSAGQTTESRLIWFDRTGKSVGEVGPPGLYGDVALAPDDRNLVVSQRETLASDVHLWVVDLRRQARSRLNPDSQFDTSPAVSPDGRIVFTSGIDGDVYVRSASGAGDAELLLKSANIKHPADWSPDGRFILYDEHHPTQRQDLWVLPLAGDRKPIPFSTTKADEWFAQFSPDGRWVVYASDESGQREVYVRDFAPDRVPAVGSTRFAISTAGGDKPRWKPDGTEIFYLAPGGKMMAVPVKPGATLDPGVPAALFDTNAAGTYSYDVTADGRFLVNTLAAQDSSSRRITVVMNWQPALRK